MANRHRRAKGGRTLYAGAGSNVAKEINETHGFKAGGKVQVGRAFGGGVKARADKRARGGRAGSSPFSSAGGKLGHGPERGAARKHGGRTNFDLGGPVKAPLAKGGAAKRARGGECEDKRKHEEEDGEDEEEEHAHGGKAGMHYMGGHGSKRRRDKGGHIDIYETKGGTHHWMDDDHSKAKGGRNWIAGAIKHPGALHKELGVPSGEKIPEKKLDKAAASDNPKLARRANLAKTLKGLHH